MGVQTSWNVDISRNSNDHILVLREATVTWLVMLACTYRVSALSGGDDVTGRQPRCGRDFAR